MRLEGKVALISGGAKGQGAVEAKLFSKEGAKVVLGDVLDDLGQQVETEIHETGAEATYLHLDVTLEADWKSAVDLVIRKYGQLDILVNNAGILIRKGIEDTTIEDWERIMDINAKGAFFLAQALGKTMLEHQYGRIINISSQAGIVALKDHMAYGSSKAALGMITKVLALEWGGQGITVNAIAPTVIRTPMGERGWSDPQLANEMRKAIPVGRFGEPAEVASLVTFLASKQASLINGAIIPVDGGYTAR